MRTRSVVIVLALLALVLLPTVGCGSGEGVAAVAGGARIGPFFFGLPFVPAIGGQTVTVGLKNALSVTAPVTVTHYTAAGVPTVRPFMVPPNAELRIPLASIVGGTPGGWVHVDTRGAGGVPLPTSGFVFPYIERETIGGAVEKDTFEGVTSRAAGVAVAFKPETTDIQIMNFSAVASPFTVSTFNPDGTSVGAPVVTAVVPAFGSILVAPLPNPAMGNVGSVRIAAAAPGVTYAACARESTFQTHAELRFRETSIDVLPALVDYGFDLEFGQDAFLNTHDFELLMSNTTGTNQTVVMQAVLRKGQLPLLTVPRVFVLNAGRTVLMRTETVRSIGLNVGEQSFFDDIFGDVFAATAFDEVTLLFQIPRTIDVSMRHFERATTNFYRVVRALPRTANACVFNLPIQEFLTTGIRNVVSICNDSPNPVNIQVQGYTPGGTLYLLAPITVPAFERFDWTPDGLTFREIPTDTVGPFVQYMRFEFFPPGGIFFRGRTTSSDALGLVRYISPTANRSN